MYKFLVFSLFISSLFFQACQKSDPVTEVDERGGFVYVSGWIKDSLQFPIHGPTVFVKDTSSGYIDRYICSAGYFLLKVPANRELPFTISSSRHGGPIYTTTIGPFSADTTLPDIQFTASNPAVVKGRLIDCNGIPVAGGAVYFPNGGFTVACDENGVFGVTLEGELSSNDQIVGHHPTELLKSEPVSLTYTSGIADAGDIMICSPLDEYISINLNGETTILYQDLFHSIMSTGYDFWAAKRPTGSGLMLATLHLNFSDFDSVTNQATVNFWEFRASEQIEHAYFGCQFNQPSGTYSCDLSQMGPLKFINYPAAVGEYYSGTLEGKVSDETGQFVPFSMVFSIKKNI